MLQLQNFAGIPMTNLRAADNGLLHVFQELVVWYSDVEKTCESYIIILSGIISRNVTRMCD